jgi:hypothetical protein
MPVSFGFSIGDFITVASAIWQLASALNATSTDTAELRRVRLELLAFRTALLQTQKLIVAGVIPTEEEGRAIEEVLDGCKGVLGEFESFADGFGTIEAKVVRGVGDLQGAQKSRGQALVRYRQRVKWTFSGKRKVEPFRRSLQSYSGLITLVLQSLQQ